MDDFLDQFEAGSLPQAPRPDDFLHGLQNPPQEEVIAGREERSRRKKLDEIYAEEGAKLKREQAYDPGTGLYQPSGGAYGADIAGRLAEDAPWLNQEEQAAHVQNFNANAGKIAQANEFEAAVKQARESGGLEEPWALKAEKYLPFARSGRSLGLTAPLIPAGERFEAGKDTLEDRLNLAGELVRSEKEQKQARGQGLLGKVGETAAHLPATLAEWYALGGLVGEGGGLAAAVARGAARTALDPAAIAAGAAERMKPQLGTDQQGRPAVAAGEKASNALLGSAAQKAIENITWEAVGGPVSKARGLTGAVGVPLATSEAQEELSRAVGGPGGTLSRLATAKSDEEKNQVWQDLAAKAIVFAGMGAAHKGPEGVRKLAESMKADFDHQGWKPNELLQAGQLGYGEKVASPYDVTGQPQPSSPLRGQVPQGFTPQEAPQTPPAAPEVPPAPPAPVGGKPWAVTYGAQHEGTETIRPGDFDVVSRHGSQAEAHAEMMRQKQKFPGSGHLFDVQHDPEESTEATQTPPEAAQTPPEATQTPQTAPPPPQETRVPPVTRGDFESREKEFNNSGLSERQKWVMHELATGRDMDSIATDPQMLKKNGEPMRRQGIDYIKNKAMEKLPEDYSTEAEQEATRKHNVMYGIESGARVARGELSNVPADEEKVVRGRMDEIRDIDRKMSDLSKKWVKLGLAGKLTPEKEQELHDEFAALDNRRKGRLGRPTPAPGQLPDEASPAEGVTPAQPDRGSGPEAGGPGGPDQAEAGGAGPAPVGPEAGARGAGAPEPAGRPNLMKQPGDAVYRLRYGNGRLLSEHATKKEADAALERHMASDAEPRWVLRGLAGEEVGDFDTKGQALAGRAQHPSPEPDEPDYFTPVESFPQVKREKASPPQGPNFMFGGAPGRQAPPPAPPGKPPPPQPLQPRTGVWQALKAVFNPSEVSDLSRATAGNLRERLSLLDRAKSVAADALYQARAYFDRAVVAEKDPALRKDKFLAFTDPYEAGQHLALPPEQQPVAAAIKGLKDEITRELTSRGLLNSFINNHLGHLWKDPQNPNATPEELGARAARRPLAGAEGFKKQRVMPTWRDGIDAGLEPATWNPVEAELARLGEMYKSVFGNDAFTEEKNAGRMRFFGLGDRLPQGWKFLSDKLGKVFAPPTVDVKEYFDRKQMEGLEEFATKNLGVNLKRPTGGMGSAAGMQTPGEVTTKFGTPEEVLAHELGHEIDTQYPQLKQALAPPALQKELEDLANLRASGRQSPAQAAYLQSPNERVANLVAAYVHAPELLKQVAPGSQAVLETLLTSTPKLRPLRDIKPSLELGQREQAMRLAGPMLTGNYAGPEESVRLMDRYLQPGLRGNALYDTAQGVGNEMNKLNLGFSAFHALGTAINSQVTAMEVALRQVSTGTFNRSTLVNAVEGIVPFAASVHDILRGSKLGAEWFKPGSQGAEMATMADYFTKAGGRAMMDPEYGFDRVEHFRTLWRQNADKMPLIWAGVRAASEALSYPIMRLMVPRTKMGAWMRMADFELGRMPPNTPPEQVRQALYRQWQSVENRMGQMTYDNLFWDHTMRDLGHLTVRSVGWNAGDIGEFGGAVADIPSSAKGLVTGKGISPRLSYAIALPLVSGILGATTQYLLTGQGPREWKDYFFPRTGKKRDDGTDERLSLPTYMKDLYSLGNRSDEGPFRVGENAFRMAKGKSSPAAQAVVEMLQNEDFYGAAIRNPEDPITTQTADEVKHLVGSFEPFSTRTARQLDRQGGGKLQQALGLFGVTPAPAYVTRTTQEQRDIEAARRRVPSPLEKKAKNDARR